MESGYHYVYVRFLEVESGMASEIAGVCKVLVLIN